MNGTAKLLIGIGAGLIAGVALSWGEATRRAEMDARQRYDEGLRTHIESMTAIRSSHVDVDGPFPAEDDLDKPDSSEDAVRVGGELRIETPISQVTPDVAYLKTAREYQGKDELAENVGESIEYISEDEYDEDDGRAKEQLLIHMGEDSPMFVHEGVVVEDWQSLIGPNILVDMYQRIPPGTENRVLYVRNNRTDTDYEVIQEIP